MTKEKDEMKREDPPDPPFVAEVRKLLKYWDDGLISDGELEGRVHDMALDPMIKEVEGGREFMKFGSCCCASHPPDRTFRMEVTIQPHGLTAKPLWNGDLAVAETSMRIDILAVALRAKGLTVHTGQEWYDSHDFGGNYWYLYPCGAKVGIYRQYDYVEATRQHAYDAATSVPLDGLLERVQALPQDPSPNTVWSALDATRPA